MLQVQLPVTLRSLLLGELHTQRPIASQQSPASDNPSTEYCPYDNELLGMSIEKHQFLLWLPLTSPGLAGPARHHFDDIFSHSSQATK